MASPFRFEDVRAFDAGQAPPVFDAGTETAAFDAGGGPDIYDEQERRDG